MSQDKSFFSRRKFLISTATATLAAPSLLRAGISDPKQKKRLRHVCIGVGGMGGHDLKNFQQHPGVDIVALCDVDETRLKKAAEGVPGARLYTDWRELLKKEKNNFDSVNVTVPDHNHFVIAYAALQNGKHVYCQKPMCHDVWEVRELTKTAAKSKLVTQLGTQHASGKGDRAAVQLLKAGVIGKIKHAYLCSNRPGAIAQYRLQGPRPANGQEPPSHLNWDNWIGTAPMRAFVPEIYHPAIWRSWQDFGTGWSGDIGCHIFDAVWKGLNLKAPLSIVAEVQESWKNSLERRSDTWPQGDHISYVFPGNEMTEAETLPLEWYDGEFYPPEEIRALYSVEKYPAESAMLIGTKGALLIPHTEMPILLPENSFKHIPVANLEERNHYHHFVDACLGAAETESHFEQSGPMTEAILLGTIAIRVPGQKLEWNPEKMRFDNYPEANKYLKRKYRKGW